MKNITYFLDLETTGLSANDKIVEIALLDINGNEVINTFVNPAIPIPKIASSIHGIFDEDVKQSPFIKNILPKLKKIVKGSTLVIYNAQYDLKYLGGIRDLCTVSCAMSQFSQLVKLHNDSSVYKRYKLSDALKEIGIEWVGRKHRAKDDAMACRLLWMHMNGGIDHIPSNFNLINNENYAAYGYFSNVDGDFKEYNHLKSIINDDNSGEKFGGCLAYSEQDNYLYRSIYH